MASTFFLAPTPKMYFFDAEGRPAANGAMHTFQSDNPSVPKPVFMDPGGIFPWANPIILDGTGGTPGLIYWENNTTNLYHLVIKDASGRQILTADNYPIVASGTGPPVTVTTDVENFLINGNFHFISNEIFGGIVSDVNKTPLGDPTVPVGITRVAPGGGSIDTIRGPQGNYTSGSVVNDDGTAIDTRIISGWTFEKTGGAALTDIIKFINSSAGIGLPGGPSQNAPRYFQYNAIVTGPSTVLDLVYTIPDVRTFAGKTISVTCDVNASGASGSTDFIIEQNFGTGGAPAPTVSTPFSFDFTTPSWTTVSSLININVPPITGSIGTNRDSFVKLRWRFPINTTGEFNITNLQLQVGSTATAFIYQTFNQTAHSVLAELISAHLHKTGDMKWSTVPNTLTPTGWIVLFDPANTIGSIASGATFQGEEVRNLYKLWYVNYPDSVFPVSGGRTGSTAADADTDFDANKTMTLLPFAGEVFGVAAASSPVINPAPTAGRFDGTQLHKLTVAELAIHSHSYNAVTGSGGEGGFGTPAAITGATTGPQGGDVPHNTMQPTRFWWLHIKL